MSKPGKIIPRGSEHTMNTPNVTCVCFDCRTSARRSEWSAVATCPKCGKRMRALTKAIKIPKKKDDKGWDSLRTFLSDRRREQRIRALKAAARRDDT